MPVEQLIKDSETEYKYKSDTKKHPTMDILDQFLYKWSDGKQDTRIDDSLTQWDEGGNVAKIAEELKALGNGGGEGVVIKTENPEVIELKSRVKTLKDGKSRVEKSLREAQDLSVTLDHRLLKDQSLKNKALELDK